jgi:hypothetical protein
MCFYKSKRISGIHGKIEEEERQSQSSLPQIFQSPLCVPKLLPNMRRGYGHSNRGVCNHLQLKESPHLIQVQNQYGFPWLQDFYTFDPPPPLRCPHTLTLALENVSAVDFLGQEVSVAMLPLSKQDTMIVDNEWVQRINKLCA